MDAADESKSLIAGLACRLPKSSNIQEFWENLMDGRDMIDTTRFPERLDGVPPRAGLIPDIDKFDAEYFGFSDTEAESMNVMLRQLLEVTYECVVDSGLTENVLQDSVTGLYLACFLPDTDPIETTKYSTSCLCTTTPFLTGHISNYYGWTGPTVSVDTACSSSLSALEMADTDLKTGRCQFAVVASVNVIINPVYLQQMAILGMLNPTGESKVFDRDAGGYVRAEGVAAIILTRKETLCRRIYATLVDVMTNCDGYTPQGIAYPNDQTQMELLKAIYKRAAVDSDQIAYMEVHSTGTKVGDKIEVGAVSDVLSSGRSTPLPIGSVKGNMGHSEATAGLASLMKCLLVARFKEIPPQLNYVHPKIPAVIDGRVVVVDKVMPLADGFISLNSFGFGGANGHLILKPYRKDRKENDQKLCLLPYKARTLEEVEAICNLSDSDLSSRIDVHGLLSGSILSQDKKRPIKGYLISSRHTEGLVCGRTIVENKADENKKGKVGLFLPNFVWDPVILDENILDIPRFEASIRTSQQILTDTLGCSFSLSDKIKTKQVLSSITAENLCTAIAAQIGIVDCIQECGVPLSYVGGSGLSEITVGYEDGCLTREQCLHIALVLGQALEEFIKEKENPDKIFKVHLPLEKVYLLGPKIKVLASLSIETSVILVSETYTNQILRHIHEEGGFYKELQQKVPFHSRRMTECCQAIAHKLDDILKCPKQSSSRFLQRKHDFLPHLATRSVLFDAQYITEMLTHASLPFKASLPADLVMIHIHLTSLSEEPEECIVNVSPHQTHTNIALESDPVSVLRALGELFLHGHDIKVAHLYKTQYPLDVQVPSVSPVVRWDHHMSYYVPEWHEFSNKVKDVGVPTYTIDTMDTEDMTTPMALMLYHSWRAITQRHKTLISDSVVAVEMQSLVMHNEALWSGEMMSGAAITVQEQQRIFTVTNQGYVLLTGSFKVHTEKVELPRIPGFDLDINQNVDSPSDEEENIHKTEILWEDCWQDFINTALEFTTQTLVGPLTRILISPDEHRKEVKSCANILTVAERVTGLCKAGNGLIIQTLVTKSYRQLQVSQPRKVSITDTEHTQVSMAMAYGVQGCGRVCDNVLLYQGQSSNGDVIGVVLLTDDETVCREIPVDHMWTMEEMQQLTPYILAHYITTHVSDVKAGDKVLVSPPIDTVAMYIMAIVEQLGGVIFTSSYDTEVRQMLDSVFPYARVLPGSNIVSNVKSLTQGEGCHVCIKFTSGELDDILSLVSHNGKMVQCSPMLDTESLDLAFLARNVSVKLPTMTEAFKLLMDKSSEDIDAMLYDLQNGSVVKLTVEGFPEDKGLLYSLEEYATFLSPVAFPKLLTVLEEPRIGLMESFQDMVEADVMAMEKLHNFVMSKPKDYSLAEQCPNTSLHASEGLHTAMNPTPLPTSPTSPSIPDIRIVSLNDISLEGSPLAAPTPTPYPPKVKVGTKMTSTPMITITESDNKMDDLHESYIEPSVPANPFQLKLAGGRRATLLSPLCLTGISHLSVPRPRRGSVDLLFMGPPRTPLTPAIQDILTPTCQEPSIVPLNMVTGPNTVFIVHPITGKLTLLKKLGENLRSPVFGIQRTLTTPRDSIHSVASYYLNAIQMMGLRNSKKHYIVGYSFGAIVAIEMAIQLQGCGKEVADLILLDGAPNLLQSQMQDNDHLRSKGKTDEQITTMFEVGSLMSYMFMFKMVENPGLTKKILANLPDKDARINTVVDMTFGTVDIGASPRQTKWLTVKHKILKKLKEPTDVHGKFHLADAAQELVRLKRIEAASDHIKSIKMVYNYRPHPTRKFDGNIHLLRIKSEPMFLTHHLSPDYDLHDWCTGKVQLKFYDGTHESFLSGLNAAGVAKDVMDILEKL